MKKFSLLVIEGSFSVRQHMSDVLKNHPELDVMDFSTSEHKTIQILKAFIPSAIVCNREFITRDFIRWLAPFFSSGEVSLLVYGDTPPECMNSAAKNLSGSFTDFIPLKNAEKETIENLVLTLSTKLNLFHPLSKEPVSTKKTTDLVPALKVIAIGASAGGPRVIKSILSHLPADLNAGVVIAQHIPDEFASSLVKSLTIESPLPVLEAKDGLNIFNGHVYVAPGKSHLKVLRSMRGGGVCSIVPANPQQVVKPSIDYLFDSLPHIYKNKIVGIILTGMGDDGMIGMETLKKAGAKTIIQDEATSMIYGMPGAVLSKVSVDHVLSFPAIPSVALRLISEMG